MLYLLGAVLIAVALAAGELVKYYFALPTPAPVIAILILFCGQMILARVPLSFVQRVLTAMQSVANILVRHMALFFIPVLVLLLLEQSALLFEYGALLLAVIIPSTAIALPLTALIFTKLVKGKKI